MGQGHQVSQDRHADVGVHHVIPGAFTRVFRSMALPPERSSLEKYHFDAPGPLRKKYFCALLRESDQIMRYSVYCGPAFSLARQTRRESIWNERRIRES